MELWDIYDRQRRTTGRFHGARHADGAGGISSDGVRLGVQPAAGAAADPPRTGEEALCQLLGRHGGAALVGETSLQTVRRELREETGIEADEADFHLVRSFREHSTFSDVYFLFHDIPLSALHLQPGETTEARWVSKAGLEALVASGEVAQPDVRRLRQLRDEFRKIWNA